MPEQLLTVLKLCLLALLYLFFLRVLRAVWTEVNPPKVATTPPAAPAATGSTRSRRSTTRTPGRSRRKEAVPTRLVVVEPVARQGTEFALGPDMTVGRAAGCNLVFDEQYVSQVHTRIFSRDGSVFVEDLGSTNGTYLARNKVTTPTRVPLGTPVRVGKTVIELRP